MTSDSDADGSLDDVQSDADIYGSVSKERSGAVITTGESRPELPTLHDRPTDVPTEGGAWLDRQENWVVAAESTSGGTRNYFTVIHGPDTDIHGRTRTLSVSSTGSTTARLGHGIRNPVVDEIAIVSASVIRQHLDTNRSENDLHLSDVDIIGRTNDIPLEHDTTDQRGEWVHCYTSPDSVRTMYEVFVPITDLGVERRGGRFYVDFTENSRVQVGGTEISAITDRQGGMYVDALHQVNEDVVPDVDYEADTQTLAETYDL